MDKCITLEGENPFDRTSSARGARVEWLFEVCEFVEANPYTVTVGKAPSENSGERERARTNPISSRPR